MKAGNVLKPLCDWLDETSFAKYDYLPHASMWYGKDHYGERLCIRGMNRKLLYAVNYFPTYLDCITVDTPTHETFTAINCNQVIALLQN